MSFEELHNCQITNPYFIEPPLLKMPIFPLKYHKIGFIAKLLSNLNTWMQLSRSSLSNFFHLKKKSFSARWSNLNLGVLWGQLDMQEKNIFYHQRKLHFDQASSSANNLITKKSDGKVVRPRPTRNTKRRIIEKTSTGFAFYN